MEIKGMYEGSRLRSRSNTFSGMHRIQEIEEAQQMLVERLWPLEKRVFPGVVPHRSRRRSVEWEEHMVELDVWNIRRKWKIAEYKAAILKLENKRSKEKEREQRRKREREKERKEEERRRERVLFRCYSVSFSVIQCYLVLFSVIQVLFECYLSVI
jgi:hypothetical protein